ncbi:hypothetical protein OSTOST_14425, partial [Ostertagia ostertagi]
MDANETVSYLQLVTACTVDEKILHRQIKKTGLTSMINLVDQSSKPSFVDEELESIFTVKEVECETHDLLECHCGGCGLLPDEVDDDPGNERVFHYCR